MQSILLDRAPENRGVLLANELFLTDAKRVDERGRAHLYPWQCWEQPQQHSLIQQLTSETHTSTVATVATLATMPVRGPPRLSWLNQGQQNASSVQCCCASTCRDHTRDGEPTTANPTFTQLLSSVIQVQVQCCYTSKESIETIRDVEPKTATSPLWHSSWALYDKVQVQCCFTSTETKKTIKDEELRTDTSLDSKVPSVKL